MRNEYWLWNSWELVQTKGLAEKKNNSFEILIFDREMLSFNLLRATDDCLVTVQPDLFTYGRWTFQILSLVTKSAAKNSCCSHQTNSFLFHYGIKSISKTEEPLGKVKTSY